MRLFHSRHQVRICSSSLAAGTGLPMPLEMSDQPISARAPKPFWACSSASTSSGVARPAGPQKVSALSMRYRMNSLSTPLGTICQPVNDRLAGAIG